MSATIEPLGEALTRREQETLALLAQGHSAAEIAAQLTLAVSSAKWHIQQIYRKLGVNNRQKAVVRAGALGLLAASPSETPPRAARARQRRSLGKLTPALRHNLPLQLTNFIGRSPQIAEAQSRLRNSRLLTLTGPGGTGKTRLALQVAAEMVDEFPDGAWHVELAPIVSPAQVPQAVAQAIGLRAETGGSFEAGPVDYSGREGLPRLLKHLHDKDLLLVLDNCEHLVHACAELTEKLLRSAPGLRVLTTSREALGVAGEHNFPVPALTVPEPGQLLPLEVVAESEAVRLFVERAAAVRPDFALTDRNAPAIVQICRRLDGIPLAVELAAARVQALSVEQIAAHLDDRFRLLVGGSRTAPPRQQTLRGAMDWSYDLLSEAERSLLRRLSVFASGWTLEAATHVAGGPEVLEGLIQLVAKSLVLSETAPGQAARFRMLETIREYALEKLAQGGEAESARGQHVAYYVGLAAEAASELRGRNQVLWLNRLERDHNNLRAALAWAIKMEDAESAQRMAGALPYFWRIRGYGSEGRGWAEAAIQVPASGGLLEPSAWHAQAVLAAGYQEFEDNLSTSLARLEMALDLYRELEDKAGIAHALYGLGRYTMFAQQDYTGALAKYQEALDFWMAVEDGWGVGACLHWMGHAADAMGDRVEARALYQRSVEVLRDVGDRWELSRPLSDLARHFWAEGDADHARTLVAETLAAYEELGSKGGTALMLGFLALISAAQGNYAQARKEARLVPTDAAGHLDPISLACLGEVDYLEGHLAEARQRFEAGLDGWREQQDLHGQAWPLARLGGVAYRLGDLDRATQLLEQSLTFVGPNGWWWSRALAELTLADVARAHGSPVSAAEYYGRSLRIVLQQKSQPDVAERLEGFAKLAGTAHQPQRAARLFGAADALRERIGTPIPAVERDDYDGAVVLARAQLDPAAFSAAWAEGMAFSWEQAAAYALET